jgi:hypothetical protein
MRGGAHCAHEDLSKLTAAPERRGRGMWGVHDDQTTVIVASRGGRCRLALERENGWERLWASAFEDTTYADFWGDRVDNFLVVGKEGRIGRIRRDTHATAVPVFPGQRHQLVGVSVGADDVWAVGNDETAANDAVFRWTTLGWPAAYRFDGKTWTKVAHSHPTSFTNASSLAPDDVWLSTSEPENGGAVLHWDGHALATMLERPAQTGGTWGIYAASAREVFTASNKPQRFDGETWTELPVAPSVDVWGEGPRHVYFAAHRSKAEVDEIIEWDGVRAHTVVKHWEGFPLSFGGRGDQAFAVGEHGLTYHLVRPSSPTR